MSASALLSGALHKAPERRTSKGGKAYVSATMREGSGDAVTWWKILCFSETAAEELLALADGDAVAVSGAFKVEIYEKNGEQRLSHTVFVDRVITAHRQKAKKRAQQSASERRLDRRPSSNQGRPEFDDQIPF
jgi:single-stranded DNA-binding protein